MCVCVQGAAAEENPLSFVGDESWWLDALDLVEILVVLPLGADRRCVCACFTCVCMCQQREREKEIESGRQRKVSALLEVRIWGAWRDRWLNEKNQTCVRVCNP